MLSMLNRAGVGVGCQRLPWSVLWEVPPEQQCDLVIDHDPEICCRAFPSLMGHTPPDLYPCIFCYRRHDAVISSGSYASCIEVYRHYGSADHHLTQSFHHRFESGMISYSLTREHQYEPPKHQVSVNRLPFLVSRPYCARGELCRCSGP